MTRHPARWERVLCVLGLAAATLALVGRLASGMVAIDPQALDQAASVLAASVPCQADAGTGDGHRLPAQPAPDRGLVALASFLSQPSPVLVPVLLPPPPRQAVVIVAAVLPPARAPPVRKPGAALPRGPPVLA